MIDPLSIEGISSHPLWCTNADGLLLADTDGRIVAMNRALGELFDYPDDALIGCLVDELVPEQLRSQHVHHRQGFEADPSTRPMGAGLQLEGVRRTGELVPVDVSLTRVDAAEGPLTFAAIRDMSDRVRAESELFITRRRRAVAEDNARIASDLHDTVIQRLFGLGLGFQSLLPIIEQADVAQRVSDGVDTVDDIIGEIRRTIFDLQNDDLADVPFRQQIVQVVDEMQDTIGFPPALSIVGPLDEVDDPGVREHLLAVLRESLSNIARHAEATTATVDLRFDGDSLSLEVADDGVGVGPRVIRSGLANMANRASLLQGSFALEMAEPSGTLVRWSVPV